MCFQGDSLSGCTFGSRGHDFCELVENRRPNSRTLNSIGESPWGVNLVCLHQGKGNEPSNQGNPLEVCSCHTFALLVFPPAGMTLAVQNLLDALSPQQLDMKTPLRHQKRWVMFRSSVLQARNLGVARWPPCLFKPWLLLGHMFFCFFLLWFSGGNPTT